MNDRDDDDDDDFRSGFPFFGGFGGFGSFFGDIDKMFQDMSGHFEDITKQMGEGFKDIGEIRFGFHPPSMNGNGPPLQQDPRDQMLKDDNESNPNAARDKPSGRRPFTWNTPDLDSRIVTGDIHGPPVNEQSPFRFSQTARQVQVVRHGDGSIECIEKTTTDGRTCTTITKTDPHGVSTTTTTCDRPAIDGAPRLVSPETPTPTNTAPTPTVNTELSDADQSFFSKLFGNLGFKPKS